MAEYPILFSAPMVRAILDGRKTQTRRIVNPRMYLVVDGDETTGRVVEQSAPDFGALALEYARCPYGAPGDRLWVRETWCARDIRGYSAERIADVDAERDRVEYRADGVPDYGRHWFPSIHMPRWASRITLEVTGVRVERLQEITEADARAEGADTTMPARINGEVGTVATMGPGAHRRAFALLWDTINGKRAPWASNPWVVAPPPSEEVGGG